MDTERKPTATEISTSRSRRITAGSIDSILSLIAGYTAVVFSTGDISEEVAKELTDRMQSKPSEEQFLSLLTDLPILTHIISISVGVMLIYYLAELITPCSLGKFIMRIKILSADGTPSSFVQRSVRFIVKHLPYLALLTLSLDPGNVIAVYSIVSTLTLAGTALIFLPEKMALYDYVAKTKVAEGRLLAKNKMN